ncbi:GntR family transcriptional regulator [Cryobacterium sp. CG_9.6]|uniref:FadR/GntR family transcriptional regulator n=1 Tax=Cryobacterium sp. CG_9.6 TaxID=2760710 RepID=UPI0024747BAE|nr:GntR family transcriptional regulator [Cryobacterium sp. CG_9.6]MDH6236425.1 DNA-binding FadR family transcriptional regulator [Cryobacterium sp. CG_9.6]
MTAPTPAQPPPELTFPPSRTDLTGTLATPLSPTLRADEITDRLITAIAIGEYLPGSKLPTERELAASLRVGRMTVRSAIARLVEEGLLETQRGRGGGSFVREQWASSSNASVHRTLSARWDVIRDTYEAVGRLQGTIARAAAEKRTDEDVTQLRRHLELFREAESGPQSQRADELLHIAICAAAHNEILTSVLLDLESRVSIAAPAHLWGATDGMRTMEERALVDHENLVDAICDQRAADAGSIAFEHARIDIELMEDVLLRAGAANT